MFKTKTNRYHTTIASTIVFFILVGLLLVSITFLIFIRYLTRNTKIEQYSSFNQEINSKQDFYTSLISMYYSPTEQKLDDKIKEELGLKKSQESRIKSKDKNQVTRITGNKTIDINGNKWIQILQGDPDWSQRYWWTTNSCKKRIGSAGCSLACLATIASNLEEKVITPEKLLSDWGCTNKDGFRFAPNKGWRDAGSCNIGTDFDLLSNQMVKAYGYKTKRFTSLKKAEIDACLDAGMLGFASWNSSRDWGFNTTSGHYIVLQRREGNLYYGANPGGSSLSLAASRLKKGATLYELNRILRNGRIMFFGKK